MSAHKPSRDEAPNDAPTPADTGVPAQPAEPVAEVAEIGGRDSGLDPTRLDPTRLDPTRLDPTRLDPTRLDPTRYGDWEKNGRCIDF